MEPDLIGKTLDKYRILEEIGVGGMGAVYKAHDTILDRVVAIKVLAPHLTRDRELVQRFLREARAIARLKHSNIVTVHDIVEAEGYHFIVMDYLEGEPLTAIIRQEAPLPLRRAVDILDQIAQALDYAHARGMIHRDVKPGNVVIDSEDHATLTDFGIAKMLQDTQLTQPGMLLGTPTYMAPELIKGQPVGPATDAYSLGVVAYEMLGGRPPFEGDTHRLLYAHVHEKPPSLSQVRPTLPPAIAEVVGKALAKRPDGRYKSAEAFVAELSAMQKAGPQLQLSLRAMLGWLKSWVLWVLMTIVGLTMGWVASATAGGVAGWIISKTMRRILESTNTPTFEDVAIITVMSALLGSIVGILTSWTAVGSMVGVSQWLILRKRIQGATHWVLASAAGWAVSLTVALTAGLVMVKGSEVEIAEAVAISGIAGLVVGIVQWLVLRQQFQKANLWIFASIIGWTMSGAVITKMGWLRVANVVGGIAGLATSAPALGLTLGLSGIPSSNWLELGLALGATIKLIVSWLVIMASGVIFSSVVTAVVLVWLLENTSKSSVASPEQ